ncbi:hypothetical protein R3P38DRAFT_2857097 [Favolaschia claudopus]|uniref:Uncharacterized protein n=1 Tax=Favolaschia claudopus TaxID=2862362 RepID=A0AAW0DIC3_9AGAR
MNPLKLFSSDWPARRAAICWTIATLVFLVAAGIAAAYLATNHYSGRSRKVAIIAVVFFLVGTLSSAWTSWYWWRSHLRQRQAEESPTTATMPV